MMKGCNTQGTQHTFSRTQTMMFEKDGIEHKQGKILRRDEFVSCTP